MLSGLTQGQKTMWAGQQLNPQAPLYNMAMIFTLPEDLKPAIFKDAFSALVAGSDAMRTVFKVIDGIPHQEVKEDIKAELPVMDFSQFDSDDPTYDQWIEKELATVFKLEECCFKSCLIKLPSNQYRWFLLQHHLITDAWSKTVQYKRIIDNYQKLVAQEQPTELDQLPQFEEFVAYEATQHKLATSLDKLKNVGQAISFGPQQLSTKTTKAARHSRRISQIEAQQLRAIIKEPQLRNWTEDLSIFLVFATVWVALIYRLTGQRNIGLQLPAHNRNLPAFRDIPGAFIELFPLAITVDQADTFLTLFQKMRTALNAWMRTAKTGHSVRTTQSDINVVMNLITAKCSNSAGEICPEVEWIHPGHIDAHHALRLQIADFTDSGRPLVSIDANDAVFSPQQQVDSIRQFFQLFHDMLEDSNRSIGHSSLVEDAIVHRSPSIRDAIDFWALFEQNGQVKASETAIIQDDHRYTYDTFNTKVNQLANYLKAQGIQSGDRVAIILPRSLEYIISVFAILKTGAAFVPIAVNYPSGRVLGILEDAQVATTISQHSIVAGLPQQPRRTIALDQEGFLINGQPKAFVPTGHQEQDLAYVLYTSGSTGLPKGVKISYGALKNYLSFATQKYGKQIDAAFCTSVGFDLTITSCFLPFLTGGQLVIFPEQATGPDLAVADALQSTDINFIKLTPSHFSLLPGQPPADCRLKTMVVGGENLRTDVCKRVYERYNRQLQIFNEYGPTEATVGCIVHRYTPADDDLVSVPIGKLIPNLVASVVDQYGHTVPDGYYGELYIGGPSLADGYLFKPELTAEKFGTFLAEELGQFYKTGDIVRWLPNQQYFEYAGRIDKQVKINGRRVELAEIESTILSFPSVSEALITYRSRRRAHLERETTQNCRRCGLPENYPEAKFDEDHICSFCRSYDNYKDRVAQYFKTPSDLKALLESGRDRATGKYDCLVLLSGGKDSTYAVAKVQEMGFRVLAFTLDNGYISAEAIENAKKVVQQLGVDHVIGSTPAMNEIFVDSLQRHCNVCDGCFKTIYTLSTQIALKEEIPFIVTGLSRGQFFETRLTEELFTSDRIDTDKIDQIILNARKAYHQVDDAVKQLLDTKAFEDETTFEKVQYVDFYRYTDVHLNEMLSFLKERINWQRPSDTGRSTNCLINQAGIFVHKKELGYSNYAYPYSWDVRIGHKNRDEALEEINEALDVPTVQRILNEIGYTEQQREIEAKEKKLVGYYTASDAIDEKALEKHLRQSLPTYMLPSQLIHLEQLPLTANGKVDVDQLPLPDNVKKLSDTPYVAPRDEFEELVHETWKEVLVVEKVGVNDNFMSIGGDSLSGIRIISRLNEELELELPVMAIFQQPTIAQLAEYVAETIQRLLAEMDE